MNDIGTIVVKIVSGNDEKKTGVDFSGATTIDEYHTRLRRAGHDPTLPDALKPSVNLRAINKAAFIDKDLLEDLDQSSADDGNSAYLGVGSATRPSDGQVRALR